MYNSFTLNQPEYILLLLLTKRLTRYSGVPTKNVQVYMNKLHLITFYYTTFLVKVHNLGTLYPQVKTTARLKWPVRPTWCNNCDLLINHKHNMFRPTLCPSSGAQGRILLHTVFSTWCADWSLGKPGGRSCAHCRGCYWNSVHSVVAVIGIVCTV